MEAEKSSSTAFAEIQLVYKGSNFDNNSTNSCSLVQTSNYYSFYLKSYLVT